MSRHEMYVDGLNERLEKTEARVALLEAAGRRLVQAAREAVTDCLRSKEAEFDDARDALANLVAPSYTLNTNARGEPTTEAVLRYALEQIVHDAKDEGRADMRDSVDEQLIEEARLVLHGVLPRRYATEFKSR